MSADPGQHSEEGIPYDRIAAFYDRLMDHVDYEGWAEYVEMLCMRHLPAPAMSCADLACGTGRFLEALDTEGMDAVLGLDRSPEMIALARKRLRGGNPVVQLAVGDLRHTGLAKPVDLLTCLYDSINYLLLESDLEKSLSHMCKGLAPRGILVFDVCTRANSLRFFRDYRDQGKAGRWSWERHAWYDDDSRMHYNEFLIEERRSGAVTRERHQQRIWSLDEMRMAIREAGLALEACYAEHGFEQGDEEANRVHFVCRRGEAV